MQALHLLVSYDVLGLHGSGLLLQLCALLGAGDQHVRLAEPMQHVISQGMSRFFKLSLRALESRTTMQSPPSAVGMPWH